MYAFSSRPVLLALAAAAFLAAGPALAEPAPRNPPLAAVGPVSPVHPLPRWYQDSNGIQLEPCLDTTTLAPANPCQLAAGGTFNPALPVAFPTNFPATVQYMWANTEVSFLGNNRGLVYIAELVASASANPAPAGSGTVSTHLRFDTNEALTPFVTFTITHPYGTFTLATDDRGDLCPANNKACDITFPANPVAGAFNAVLSANTSVLANETTVGSYLAAIGAPPGFIGDGASRVQVTGSPKGTNFVRIQGPATGLGSLDLGGSTCAGGTIPNCAESILFTVIGRVFNPAGGPTTRFAVSGPATGGAGVVQSFTVTATDVNGNTTTGYAGTVQFTSNDPQASLPGSATLVNGVGTFQATPKTVGSFVLTARDQVTPAITGSRTMAVTAGPVASLIAVSGDAQVGGVSATLAAQLVVRALDAFGNPTSASVTFTPPAGGAVAPATTLTDLAGEARTTATLGPSPGVQTFSAAAVGVATPVTFGATAGVPGQAVTLELTGLSAGVTAGVSSGFTVAALDAFGGPATLANGAAGAVTFTSSDPAAILPAAAQLTLGSGVFAATFRTAGAQTITGTLTAAPSATATAGTAVSPGPAATLALTSGSGQSGLVGTPLALPLVVRVTDAFGNARPGVTVTFTPPAGGAASPAASVSAADGTASTTATLGTVAGPQGFSASAAGLAGSPVAFTATATPGPASALTITGLSAATTAGVAAGFTVTARDAFGNLASGFAGTVGFTSTDGAATLPAASGLTAGSGAFSATFRTAGARTLSAAVTGAPGVNGSAPTTVAAAAAATLAAASGSGQAGTVGAPLGAPFVARVSDAFGNPVSGVPVTFAAPAGGSITPVSTTTDAAGQASATGTLSGSVGAQSFTASSAGLSGSPLTFGATAAPGPAATLAITGLAASTTAGAAAGFTVTARDAFGNPATTFAGTVAFTSTDPAATLPAAGGLTAGAADFSATFRTAGARTLTAAVVGSPAVTGSAPTTVVAAAAATLAASSGGGQSGQVGQPLAAPLVVRASDAFGNPVSGVTVSFGAPSGGAVAPASVGTDAAGLAATTGTLGGAVGAQAFSATAAGLAGSPVAFAATAGPGAPATLALTGLAVSTAAGAASGFTVTARDAFGNLATTFTGTVSFGSTDPAATLPGPSLLTAGVGAFSATFRTAGARALSAFVTTAPGVSVSAPTTVVAGPAAGLAAVSGRGQSGTVGLALAAPFVARVTDAFGNPVAGATVAFAAPATGSVTPTAATTGADGTAAALGTLPSTPGAAAFTAASGALAGSPVTFTATAAPGAPTILVLSGAPATSPAGTAFSVTVEAFDAFFNPTTQFSGPLSFTSSDPGAVLPASPALALGVGTFSVTLVGAGSRTLTAALTGQAAVADTATVEVVAGAASALALVSGGGQTGLVGQALAAPFVVRATDAFGNPKAGVQITFSAPATGSTSPATAATAADGTAGAVGTLGRTSGAQAFTAASPGLSGSPVSFGATASPGPAASLSLVGLPAALAAGATSNVVVTALDAFGNVASGFAGAVLFTSNDPAALLPAGAALTAGTGTFPVVLKTVGSRSVTVQAPSAPALTATATTAVGPAAPATLALVATPGSSSPAGAASASPATVLVTDSLGNPVPGFTVTFAAAGGGSISPTTTTTGADGRASATPTVGTVAGPYTFTASASAGGAALSGSPASFTVTAVAGAGSHLALERQGSGTVLDCGCYDLKAKLQDAFGNTVAQGLPGVTVALTGQARVTATELVASGLPAASVTGALKPDGTALITVCDQRPEVATASLSAAGLTGASLDLTWLLGPTDAAASGFASDTSVLTAFSGRANVTVTPRSACGNPAELGPTVVIALNGPGTITPTRFLGGGVYGATVAIQPCPATPATQVTARIGTLDLTPIDLAITCLAPSSANTTVAFDRAELVVCDNAAKDAVQVTVTPRDDTGALMGPGHQVALALPGFTGGPAADAGDGTYVTTYTAAGCAEASRTLAVAVNGVALTPPDAALPVRCAAVDAAASGISVAGAPALADGRAQVELTVAALNSCGDPARGRPVVVTTSLGTLGAPTGDTDLAGTHFTWLTAAQAGTATVGATVDGVALAPATVLFNAPPAGGGGGCSSGGGAGLPALVLLALGLGGVARRRWAA